MGKSTNRRVANERRGDRTRANIVECAKQLFYARGFDGTSFSDIVDAAKLSRGNIYHYFKTKDEIAVAVVDSHLEEFQALLDTWDQKYSDPRQQLAAFITMITGRKGELIEYGCPIGSLNTELGKDRRELQDEARKLFDLFRDWIAERFRRLGKGSESEALALHLLGRAQGVAVIAHVYHDAKLLQRETRRLQEWVGEI